MKLGELQCGEQAAAPEAVGRAASEIEHYAIVLTAAGYPGGVTGRALSAWQQVLEEALHPADAIRRGIDRANEKNKTRRFPNPLNNISVTSNRMKNNYSRSNHI